MNRDEIANAKRVVIKVGSSSLTGKAGEQLDRSHVQALANVIANLRSRGAEVLLVSSGAIATGLAPLGLTSRPKDLATQQAAASVGQGLLISYYNQALSEMQILSSQVLLTIDDVVRRSHYQNAQRTLLKLLQLGVVPIINENDTVAVQEIRFGDNDRLSALVSHLVGADLLVLVTDIDALYDAPPTQSGARRISDVPDVTTLSDVEIGGVGSSGVGSGGMITKIEAARIATGAGVAMALTSLENLENVLAGEDVGTFFHAVKDRKPSRLLWLAHASTPQGKLVLDSGAVTAIKERGVSLLPAGVVKTEGEFISGDTVELVSETGEVVARGLVAFDSIEIPKLLGKSTKELGQTLGIEYERELVHRDDLILI
jgi:glutamate 5-kinase